MPLRLGLVILSLILSLLIGTVIARGNGQPGAGAKDGATHRLVIGFSLDTLKEERWQRDRDTFVQAAEALGAQVLVQSANSDDRAQVQNCQSLIGQGVDCLVIAAHNGEVMAGPVDQAAAAGIPVIAYDRLIMHTPNLALYITFDNVKVGREQARFLAERLKERKPARIVRIYGSPADNNAKLFKQGQDEILKPLIDAGAIQVVHEDWALDWRPDNAKRITDAAVTETGTAGFDAVLASNDGTAAGAIEALRTTGLLGKVLVTGQDAELAALQRIAQGEQAMTIYKPLPVLAKQAAELAVKLARRQVVVAPFTTANGSVEVPSVFGPVTTVTAANIVETVVKDGFHPYDAIYAGVPAERRPAKP